MGISRQLLTIWTQAEIACAMIVVQMRVNDDINVLRTNAERSQAGMGAIALGHVDSIALCFVEAIAVAGIDHDVIPGRLNQQIIDGQWHQITLVRGQVSRPEPAWNQAKDAARIHPGGGVVEQIELDVT